MNFTYAKGSNIDYDATFEQNAAMFGKNTYRDSRSKEEMLKEAVEVANKADVILLAIGETAEMSGESSSRTNISIPQAQKDLLKELKKQVSQLFWYYLQVEQWKSMKKVN